MKTQKYHALEINKNGADISVKDRYSGITVSEMLCNKCKSIPFIFEQRILSQKAGK